MVGQSQFLLSLLPFLSLYSKFPYSTPITLVSQQLKFPRARTHKSRHLDLLLPEIVAAMGNCCSNENGGHSAAGGTGAYVANPNNGHNEAVDALLKSRGYDGVYSHVEVLHSLCFFTFSYTVCYQMTNFCFFVFFFLLMVRIYVSLTWL